MTNSPSVSVIIAARDAEPTLGRTLQALRDQDLDRTCEVIVIDDGSHDATAEIAQRHEPFVRLIRTEKSEGPGAARNRGARAASAPVLAFTDADCFPTRQWLARGLEAMTDADLVQGAVQPDPAVTRTPFDRTVVVAGDRGFYQTANLLVRREMFDLVGGFRDWAIEGPNGWRVSADRRRGRATRTPIGEDTLFGWTACRRGARSAFAPDAVVHHAVAGGILRDELADRWHWSRDMPGLARLVPELRASSFYRRWFFHRRTARFDVAVAALLAAAVTRRGAWLLGLVPYADWIRREASSWTGVDAAGFAIGSVGADAVTLGGLLKGSLAWRCVVL